MNWLLVVHHLIYIVIITLVLIVGGGAVGLPWFRGVFRAWDVLGAALFGGDGKHTISAYCGAANGGPLIILRWVIDLLFGKGHCRGAAQNEGMVAAY